MNKIVNLPNDLASIRINTPHDLADAQALAANLLDRFGFRLRRISHDLLTAVLMTNAYLQENKTLANVLFYISDTEWDSKKQIILSFRREIEPWKQPDAAAWRMKLVEELETYTHAMADDLIDNCIMHWGRAFISAKAEASAIEKYNDAQLIPKTIETPKPAIQIFELDTLSDGFGNLYSMTADKRANGLDILTRAQNDDGFRIIPDAEKAIEKLEAAKSEFENLIEPMARLQLDLVLAAAMPAQDFQITPMLLLGEPGIGKTHLATQLASVLGVKSEKISAGGGDASFQFTGSHPTWTSARPGIISELMAKSKYASPVLVIDEVDKIAGDSRYPVVPLLLDLLEPNTAKKFKDQFLDIKFDASRIICILTANTLDGIPPALLSRVDVFHIPRPGREQRRRIIEQTHAELCKKTEQQIVLEAGGIELLASRVDLDIRKLVRLVREAFARALQSKKTLAELMVPALEMPETESQKTEIRREPGGKEWKFH